MLNERYFGIWYFVSRVPSLVFAPPLPVYSSCCLFNTRMFNGILSDVIGRDGPVSERASANKSSNNSNNNNNYNAGGGGDSFAQPFSDHSTPDVTSMVGVFERHVTHYHNHLLRMRDPAAMTSSSTNALQSVCCRQCDQEVAIPSDIDAPTSVSNSAALFLS